MPHLTFDGQSFLVDGKRIWMLGAGVQYARTPAESWPRMLAACRQAGFNTIETACPWIFHEPRPGRFDFDDRADVRRFIQYCDEAGLYVVLRIGPYIDSGYDGGGLPAWLLQTPGLVVREGNEHFLERVNTYFQRLLAQVADLQVTDGGPIIAVQCEQDWHCANDGEATRYLRELTRNARENGIKVPILSANDLWQETPGTIDTWQGWDELLVHLRQIRTIQPDRPAIVSGFDPANVITWGEKVTVTKTPKQILHRLAQVLAAGGQPIVAPFHGGSNVGAVGGRLAGSPDRYITQATVAGAPLGEAGSRTGAYHIIKRLVTFANHFGHVFAELDPAGHGPVLDVDALSASTSPNAPKTRSNARLSVVSLRGTQGDVSFIFAPEDSADEEAVLLLENGMRLPVHLGDQSVGWYVFDVDLRGGGRLDYTNLCPFAVVDRSILVLHGPAKSRAFLSIDDTPVETVVPSGRKPNVLQVRDMTVVVCSREQIDATYVDPPSQTAGAERAGGTTVYVGIGGFDGAGEPFAHPDYPKAYIISSNANVVQRAVAAGETGASTNGSARSGGRDRSTRKSLSLRTWHAATCRDYVDGVSQRFASLDGPQTLATCGAPFGYGWYRLELDASSLKGQSGTRKRLCHLPGAGDRIHLFVDGAMHSVIGHGPGAQRGPFELSLAKGTGRGGRHTIVALVDNLGRFSEGNDLDDRKGLFSHIYAIKPLGRSAGGAKPVAADAEPVHPFDVRGYIAGRTFGQRSHTRQLIWRFTHTRVTPLLLDIDGGAMSGTIVLNDQPLAYYSGATGGALMRLLLNPKEVEPFKRGKNELRFAPDATEEADGRDALSEFGKRAVLYECVENLSDQAQWAFAKWEPPMLKPPGHWPETSASAARSLRGVACWWQSRFTLPDSHPGPWWFDTNGLSKGQVFINGHHLGRYFTATSTGKSVGPQTRLHLPVDWLDLDGENVLLIFDEHGFAPHRTKLVVSETGDLDQA